MINEKEVTAYVTIPDCFMQGCSEDIVSSVRTAETILPTTGYMRECSLSLIGKRTSRKADFPVTPILPAMTDPSTKCRTRTLTVMSILEDWF